MAKITVCRVCLSRDRRLYSIANVTLEKAYDQITGRKLQRAGRPTTFCCVCLCQLQRCSTFIEAAREANDILDKWHRNIDVKLTEQPLFTFEKTATEVVTYTEATQELDIPFEHKENHEKIDIKDLSLVKNETVYSDTEIFLDDGLNAEDYVPCSDNIDDVTNEGEKGDVKNEDTQDAVSNDVEKVNAYKRNPSLPVNVNLKIKVEDSKGTAVSKQRKRSKRIPMKINKKYIDGLKRNIFCCGVCDYNNIVKEVVKVHFMIEHDVRKPLSCKECEFKCTSKYLLQQHISVKHTKEKLFACDKCNFRSVYKGSLKSHMTIHTNEKLFECDSCNYKCNTKSHIFRHIKSKHSNGVKTYACKKCDFKSKDKTTMQMHFKLHINSQRFFCNECDYKSKTIHLLKVHKMKHTGEKPFACDTCDYKCVSVTLLRNHTVKHTSQKSFECAHCDFKCYFKYSLIAHVRKHNDEKPLLCDKCDFKCKYAAQLKVHLRRHNRLYTCNECDFKCEQRTVLQQHLSNHSDEKQFKCYVCHFKFSRPSKLRDHLMTHTGEKPFQCHKCDYKSNRKYALTRHLIKHRAGDEKGQSG